MSILPTDLLPPVARQNLSRLFLLVAGWVLAITAKEPLQGSNGIKLRAPFLGDLNSAVVAHQSAVVFMYVPKKNEPKGKPASFRTTSPVNPGVKAC